MIKQSDKEIIRQLQSNEERTIDKALTYLYMVSLPTVKNYILHNKGNEQDVDDIFHDGLIAFYNLVRQKKLTETTNVEAYIYSICRNMWKKKLITAKHNFELADTHHVIPVEEIFIDRLFSEERQQLLATILAQLGENCQQLLHYYYYDRLRIKTIVARMNFSNDQVARNKKLSCMKKLRTIVLESPYYVNLLLDK